MVLSQLRLGQWPNGPSLKANTSSPPQATVTKCAEELAAAMRSQSILDAHNHQVRVMQTVPTAQGTLWDDIRSITRPNMEVAVAHRRNGVVADVTKLKIDMDFYNGLHSDEPPLQTSFNFNPDLADAGLLTSSSIGRDLRPAQSPLAVPPSSSRPSPFRPSSPRASRGPRPLGSS